MEPMRRAVRQSMTGDWRRVKRRVGIALIPGLRRRTQRGSRVGFTVKGFYARFLELGTTAVRPTPFMRRAFNTTADLVMRDFAARMWDAIRAQVNREYSQSPVKRWVTNARTRRR